MRTLLILASLTSIASAECPERPSPNVWSAMNWSQRYHWLDDNFDLCGEEAQWWQDAAAYYDDQLHDSPPYLMHVRYGTAGGAPTAPWSDPNIGVGDWITLGSIDHEALDLLNSDGFRVDILISTQGGAPGTFVANCDGSTCASHFLGDCRTYDSGLFNNIVDVSEVTSTGLDLSGLYYSTNGPEHNDQPVMCQVDALPGWGQDIAVAMWVSDTAALDVNDADGELGFVSYGWPNGWSEENPDIYFRF